jgi:hypothetical protein
MRRAPQAWKHRRACLAAGFVLAGLAAVAPVQGEEVVRQAHDRLVVPGLGSESKLPLPVSPYGAVALSADGNMALSGGLDNAAYVFVRSGGVWIQEARLTGSDAGPDSRFGSAVALAADGSRALVGAYHGPGSALCPYGPNTCGAAYVFVRNSGTWTQEAKLVYPESGGFSFGGVAFGAQVSLSNDGTTALVSAPFVVSSSTFDDGGAVTIFQRSGSTWTLEQKIEPADPVSFGAFGISAVLSGDGRTALVGSISSSAYVFTRSGTVWSQQVKLTNPDGDPIASFSSRVSLTADGNRAAISSYASCTSGASCGAVYLFSRSGTAWAFDQKLAPADATAGDYFGWQVTLSQDGQTLLAAAFHDSCAAGADCGKLYLFIHTPAGFAERLGFRASDTTASDSFGTASTLSGDGTTALARRNPCGTVSGLDCGDVYAFTFTELAVVATPTLSEAGLAALACLLAAAGALLLRRKTA